MVDLYSFSFLEKTHTVKIYLIVSNFINIKFVNERVAEELYNLGNKVNSTQTSELNGRNVARYSILLSKILARFRQTVYMHRMTRVSKCSALFSRYFPSHRFILKRFIDSKMNLGPAVKIRRLQLEQNNAAADVIYLPVTHPICCQAPTDILSMVSLLESND